MSHIEHRLAAVPITNHVMWNKINAIVKANPLPLRHSGALELRCYQVDTDTWEHFTVPAQISYTLAELIKWTPLGADHFQEYLVKGELNTPYFDHPSDPRFLPFYLEIDWLCRMTEVSHALHFDESEGSWYWEITSAAVGESFTGKNRSLSLACESVLEHLFKVNRKYLCEKRGFTDEGKDVTERSETKRDRQYIGVQKGSKSFGLDLRDCKILRVTSVNIIYRHGEPVDKFDIDRVECNDDRIAYRFNLKGTTIGYVYFDLAEMNIEWNFGNTNYVGREIDFTVDVAM